MSPVVGSMLTPPWAGPLTTWTVAGSKGRLVGLSCSRTATVTGLVPSVSAKSARAIGKGVPLGTVRSSSCSTPGRGFGRRCFLPRQRWLGRNDNDRVKEDHQRENTKRRMKRSSHKKPTRDETSTQAPEGYRDSNSPGARFQRVGLMPRVTSTPDSWLDADPTKMTKS